MGDCWFLAGMASLAMHKDMFAKVVPLDQSFERSDYTGAFRFRFWRYGKWEEVVVDDYLPTKNGRLFLNESDDSNEFWPALFEKAYAKIHGSYGAIDGGWARDSFTDFSGGILEIFKLKSIPDNLFEIMFKADQKGALMSCSTPGKDEGKTDRHGIVPGHAYSITKVIKLEDKGKQHQLIRVRNPWGNSKEWNGEWCDAHIKRLPAETKAKHDIVDEDDGEFYVSMNDLLKQFKDVSICHIKQDRKGRSNDASVNGFYEVKAVHGSWKSGVNAGGCRNHLETFATNPQYKVTIKDADLDNDKMATLIISLMQKGARTKEGKDIEDAYQYIGFYVYSIKESTKLPLDTDFFRSNSYKGISRLISLREEVKRFTLEPGVYVIIPCTFQQDREAEFYLRIFAENKPSLKKADDDDDDNDDDDDEKSICSIC